MLERPSTPMSPGEKRLQELERLRQSAQLGVFAHLNLKVFVATLVVVFGGIPAAALWHGFQVHRNARLLLEAATRHEEALEWREAENALRTYLQVRGEDFEVSTRLAHSIEKGAASAADLARAVSLYADLAHREPDRLDLRAKLGELQLSLSASDAKRSAEIVLAEDPQNASALKTRALAMYELLGSGREPNAPIVPAAAALHDAWEKDPADLAVASRLAILYRQFPDLIAPTRGVTAEQLAQRADALMDEAVAQSNGSAEARLARFAYRRQFRVRLGEDAKADEDLTAVLQADPKNVEAHLAAAQRILSPKGAPGEMQTLLPAPVEDRAALAEARKHFEAAITVAPSDPRPRRGVADVCWLSGDPATAIETLKEATRLDENGDPLLRLRLAAMQIHEKQWDDAERTLADLDKTIEALRARATDTVQIAQIEALSDLVRATWFLEVDPPRRSYVRGADLLAKVTRLHQREPFAQAAMFNLGLCQLALGQWDLAADSFRKAAGGRQGTTARIKAAEALFKANRFEESIAEYKTAIAGLGSNDQMSQRWEALVGLAAAEQGLQQTLPSPKRDWTDFQKTVQSLESLAPDSPVPAFLRLRAELAGADGADPSVVLARRKALEERFAKSPEFWSLATDFALSAGDLPGAQRAFETLATIEGRANPVLAAKIELAKGNAQGAAELLAKAGDAVAPTTLMALEADIALRRGQVRDAVARLEKLAEADPADPMPVFELAQLATANGDDEGFTRWQAELEKREGKLGTLWRFSKIDRLMRRAIQGDQEVLGQIRELTADLSALRPQWSSTLVAEGLQAEIQGRLEDAVRAYAGAYRLGDRRTEVSQRLLGLLFLLGRYADAERHLEELPAEKVQSAELLPLAVRLALRADDPDRAIALARAAASPRRADAHCLLGQALLASKAEELLSEARAAFLRAVELEPNHAGYWAALALFHVSAGDAERSLEGLAAARAAAALLVEKDGVVSAARQALLLAWCLSFVGDVKGADPYFRIALRKGSSDPLIRQTWSRSFFALDLRETVSEIWAGYLKSAPAEVTKTCALLLAAAGPRSQDQMWSEFLASDPRIASLGRIARGGPENLMAGEAALGSLPAGEERRGDFILRARIATLMGDAEAAWSQYVKAAAMAPTANEVAEMAEFARDHQVEDAGPAIAAAIDALSDTDKARLPLAVGVAADPKAVLEKAREFAQPRAEGDTPILALSRAREAADLIAQSLGTEPAADFLSEHAGNTLEGKIVLSDWLAQHGVRFDEAARIAVEIAEPSASPRSTAYVARIFAQGRPAADLESRGEAVFRKVMAESRRATAPLLLELSVLRERQGKIDEAVELAQQAIAAAPADVQALNNLAWFLTAYRKEHAKALEMIDQAIGRAGPLAELCDTKGVALLGAGRKDEAVRLLEANALQPGPATHGLLHLAEAYEAIGKPVEARRVAELVRKRGLRNPSPRDQNVLDKIVASRF